MAIVHFRVDAGNGHQVMHTERFYLAEKMEWKLTDFFCCIGLMERGVLGQMQWDKIVGKRGRAYFVQKTVPGKYSNYKVNSIDYFCDDDPGLRVGPGHPIPDFRP